MENKGGVHQSLISVFFIFLSTLNLNITGTENKTQASGIQPAPNATDMLTETDMKPDIGTMPRQICPTYRGKQ